MPISSSHLSQTSADARDSTPPLWLFDGGPGPDRAEAGHLDSPGLVRGRGFAWRAAILYLLLALPLVVVHVYLAGPFQVPDEDNHFLRIVQLARGDLVAGRLTGGNAGGSVDLAAVELTRRFAPLQFRPDRKLEPAALAEARRIGWKERGVGEAAFGNTAIYPPFFYGPAIAAVRAGQLLNLSVLNTATLARLATGLTALALAALAIGLMVNGRAWAACVLLLPGTIGLFASFSQDALLISALALAVGLSSRAVDDPEATPDWTRVLVAAILGAAVAARPPYLPLLGLLLLPPLRLRAGRLRGLLAAAPLLGLAGAIVVLWTVVGAAPAKVPFRPGDGVSIAGQLAYLAGNPAALFQVAINTVVGLAWITYQQFVGVLGWLDAYFPKPYYRVVGVILLVVLALSPFSGRGRGLRGRKIWAPPAIVLLTIALLYGAQYLAWTPVGAAAVDGVQGRYFLPLALLLSLSVPGLAGDGSDRHRMGLALGAWSPVVALALANLALFPYVLLLRYLG